MSLAKLVIHNVRNIRNASLIPSSNINLIVGPNASGKSALLEAIYLLGRAGSFRTARSRQVIHFEADALTVSGQARQAGGATVGLGIQIDRQGVHIKVSGQADRPRSELAYCLPVQLMHPGSHDLLEGGPQGRREFLDWGLFHIEPGYLSVWRNYRRALKQRNRLLKDQAYVALDVWDRELAEYGTIVASERARYLSLLKPHFVRIAQYFFVEQSLTLQGSPGWDPAKDLAQVLFEERDRDIRYGHTQSGPQKGDFQALVEGRNAAAYFSRGQIKLVVFILKLAQFALLRDVVGKLGCMLIDDVASELDDSNRKRLLAFLADFDSQFFITATSGDCFDDAAGYTDCSVFRVDHGCITPA